VRREKKAYEAAVSGALCDGALPATKSLHLGPEEKSFLKALKRGDIHIELDSSVHGFGELRMCHILTPGTVQNVQSLCGGSCSILDHLLILALTYLLDRGCEIVIV
jgi:hypothetical protein